MKNKSVKRVISKLLSLAMTSSAVPTALAAEAPVNLVPDEAFVETANYVCTWNIQDWVAWHEEKTGGNGNKRDTVDPYHLFDSDIGWAAIMYPEIRSDLIFLLDDGWDLPYGTQKNGTNKQYFGSQVLPEDKFPAAEYGSTPQEKLKTLNQKITDLGWKGTGIWICASESSAYPANTIEEYWRIRLEWSKYAGIAYWKIDWGDHQRDINWRRKISDWAEEIYPELIIEHIVGGSGTNDKGNTNRITDESIQNNTDYAAFSDVFRTYDVLDALSVAITFDRVGEQLLAGYTEKGNALGLMNAEDETYMCASLGLSMGVMRFPVNVAADTNNSGDEYYGIGSEPGYYFEGGEEFAGTKASRNRLDEVARAVLWQRIAPPYETGGYDTALSNEYLSDDWNFTAENCWEGGTRGNVTQKAPAVIARGINLPKVTADGGEIPFVSASRNPNGAISVASYGRTHINKGYQVARADVTMDAGDLTGKIGVFGYYKSLTLKFNQDLTGKQILAQDLLADEAENITSRITVNGDTVTIPGELIEEIGLSAATKGDSSEPGLVIQIGDTADFFPAPALYYGG